MKIVKKILVGVGIFIVLLVVAGIAIPMIFKNDIKAAVDKAIAKNINADVVFDVNNFSLSVFRHFPNITAEISELGVFNRAPFEGVHLFVVDRLEVEVNLKDVLFGNQLRVKGITLVRPQINIQVMKDGKANYNITYPSTDTAAAATKEPSKFSFGIDHWEIIDGDLVYDDQSIPYYLSLDGLQHSGSGDFTQDVFDLKTKSKVDTLNTRYGAMELLTNKTAEAEATISISEDISKFTFKENKAKINDFAMSFDGWCKMNPKDYGMDITFKSPENSFKSLLSLVPGMYTKDFPKIETSGDLSFNGFVKGTYSDSQMPAFNVDLKVNEAMFKYPDLPTAVNHINMDLLVDNKDGVINHTLVDLKKLHLDFGSNPVDARLLVQNLIDYRMDGNVKATLNLAELNKMFPMPGLEMKGLYSVDARASGVYDSVRKTIPQVEASMSLAGGYVKSSQLPVPLEEVGFKSTIRNSSGKMAETIIEVDNFSMLLEGEKLTASMMLTNLNDYTWEVKANGGVDLEKITKIFPLDGMKLAGKIKANLETRGKMSDVTAKRYDKLPTSGGISISGFRYEAKSLPYVVTIGSAEGVFDPRKIELKQIKGTIGKTDYDVKGLVTNYIGYVLGSGTISGNVTYHSNLLDLNEFMTSSTTQTATTDTTSLHVIPIPNNIDFVLKSSVNTVKMMDYTMTDAKGDIIVKDGVANLSGLKFNLLGGAFAVDGSYSTRDIKHPRYDFALKIENMSIQQAANSFSIVKTYAPIAGAAEGKFNTDFKLNGELKPNMMPNLATVNGAGLIKVLDATMTQSKLISGISSLTKLENTGNVALKDVVMSATITNGRLSVKPFDMKFGSYKTSVGGSTGMDGSLDYSLKMNVPAGQLGSQFQGFVNQYGGAKNSTSEIPITIGIGGTYDNPKTSLVTKEQEQQVKEAVTNAAQQKGQEAVQNAVKGTQVEETVNSLLGVKKTDSTKKDSTKTAQPDAVNDLQNKLQNLLKKKKK